jgi:hypothetical protein
MMRQSEGGAAHFGADNKCALGAYVRNLRGARDLPLSRRLLRFAIAPGQVLIGTRALSISND